MARIERRASPGPASRSQYPEVDGETIRSVQLYLRARRDRLEVETRLAEAWDRFFSVYDPVIRRCARRGVPQTADQCDRSQEVWRRVICRLAGYRPERAPFGSWVRTIVLHVAADQARRAARFRYADMENDFETVAGEADYEQVEERRRRVEIAMQELRARLSAANYQIIHDHLFERKTCAEIAAARGLTVGQVHGRIHRGMVMLRELLLKV